MTDATNARRGGRCARRFRGLYRRRLLRLGGPPDRRRASPARATSSPGRRPSRPWPQASFRSARPARQSSGRGAGGRRGRGRRPPRPPVGGRSTSRAARAAISVQRRLRRPAGRRSPHPVQELHRLLGPAQPLSRLQRARRHRHRPPLLRELQQIMLPPGPLPRHATGAWDEATERALTASSPRESRGARRCEGAYHRRASAHAPARASLTVHSSKSCHVNGGSEQRSAIILGFFVRAPGRHEQCAQIWPAKTASRDVRHRHRQRVEALSRRRQPDQSAAAIEGAPDGAF